MPWKKGQSGNPTGRKKNLLSVKKMLEVKLQEAKAGGPNRLSEFCETMITEAIGGDYHWGGLLLDRYEGKVAERVEVDMSFSTSFAGLMKRLRQPPTIIDQEPRFLEADGQNSASAVPSTADPANRDVIDELDS